MNLLRNRFLSTTAFALAPPDPPAGGKTTVLNEDVGNENDAGDDAGAQAGQDTGGAGDDQGGDGEGADGDDDEPAAGAEDDELADLTPEQRVKVEARLNKEIGWRDRQIDKLYAKRRSAEQDVEAMRTIADPATRRAPAGQQDDPNRKFTAEEVKSEAAKLNAQGQYDRDCEDTDASGKAAYGDKWGPTLAKLPKLGGVEVEAMVDILATDQPHVVLFQLADPETFERVMSLPPARRRNEFVKLSLKEAPKPRAADSKRPGDVPLPPRTLQAGRRTAAQRVNLHDDKTPDDAWYEERNRTRRKKFSNVQ